MAGKALKSTDLRASEIEVSSGGCRTGEAISPASTSPMKPTTARLQTTALKPTDTIVAIMTQSLLCTLDSNRTENSVTQSNGICKEQIGGRGRKSLTCASALKVRFEWRDDRNRSLYQRARIHGVRAVLRAEAHGGGRLWTCPGARRDLRLPRRALLWALLFRPERRERQD